MNAAAQRQRGKPDTFADAVRATVSTNLTLEEKALLGEVGPESSDAVEPILAIDDVEPRPHGTHPAWVVVPPNLAMPPEVLVTYVRCKAKLTRIPSKGDRSIIIWGLTASEEMVSLKRCMGENLRSVSEMTKMTIRAIDGVKVDWSGRPGPGNVNTFWDEIGPAYRQQLINVYLKTHALSSEDQADFFVNCLHIEDVS